MWSRSIMYNPPEAVVSGGMKLFLHREVRERGWRGVLVVVAVCSLTFSLATRFWATSTAPSHTTNCIDRRSVEPARQHLDRDATRWVEPAANFGIIGPTVVETRLAPAEPLLPKHVFSDSLYNRPPPSPRILL